MQYLTIFSSMQTCHMCKSFSGFYYPQFIYVFAQFLPTTLVVGYFITSTHLSSTPTATFLDVRSISPLCVSHIITLLQLPRKWLSPYVTINSWVLAHAHPSAYCPAVSTFLDISRIAPLQSYSAIPWRYF